MVFFPLSYEMQFDSDLGKFFIHLDQLQWNKAVKSTKNWSTKKHQKLPQISENGFLRKSTDLKHFQCHLFFMHFTPRIFMQDLTDNMLKARRKDVSFLSKVTRINRQSNVLITSSIASEDWLTEGLLQSVSKKVSLQKNIFWRTLKMFKSFSYFSITLFTD